MVRGKLIGRQAGRQDRWTKTMEGRRTRDKWQIILKSERLLTRHVLCGKKIEWQVAVKV